MRNHSTSPDRARTRAFIGSDILRQSHSYLQSHCGWQRQNSNIRPHPSTLSFIAVLQKHAQREVHFLYIYSHSFLNRGSKTPPRYSYLRPGSRHLLTSYTTTLTHTCWHLTPPTLAAEPPTAKNGGFLERYMYPYCQRVLPSQKSLIGLQLDWKSAVRATSSHGKSTAYFLLAYFTYTCFLIGFLLNTFPAGRKSEVPPPVIRTPIDIQATFFCI